MIRILLTSRIRILLPFPPQVTEADICPQRWRTILAGEVRCERELDHGGGCLTHVLGWLSTPDMDLTILKNLTRNGSKPGARLRIILPPKPGVRLTILVGG